MSKSPNISLEMGQNQMVNEDNNDNDTHDNNNYDNHKKQEHQNNDVAHT